MAGQAAATRRIAVRPIVVGLLLLAATALPDAARSAAAPSDSGHGLGAPTAMTENGSHSVTLVTGDRVNLQVLADGRTTADVVPAPRPDGSVPQFHVTEHDGDLHVLPTDMLPLVPDLLDPALFDVTGLVEQGFDDVSSETLPLVLSYEMGTPRTMSAQRLPAARSTRRLESVDAVAVETDRADADEFGAAVWELARSVTADLPDRAAAAPRSTTDAGPLDGVDKIWLDQRVEALLDQSTAQINAPSAWDAGFDGSGTTIAVLDTGIDDTHPDLAAMVVAAQDFTFDGNPRDLHGHGTHVASIAAGSGAASGGQRQGVAPGAELVNGKVLDATGFGLLSWTIEAMEWAAADQDADIVNVSLGLLPGSFGAPLLTGAVEQLSADHGTLFVVAAGNLGCDECIGSPADAASALTVGAVDRSDNLAELSSRGPVPGTFAVKPDVTAPGIGIFAARADGTGDDDGAYRALSGTSMATPHVSGAAALLRQARPGLDADALKAALMGTAVPTDDQTVYAQGAGRIDVGRAVTSDVLSSPGSLDFGHFRYPQAGHEPVRQTVTYRNLSDDDVTLQLTAQAHDVDGSPAATGVVTVQPTEVTVAAGASSTVDVVLDIAAGAPGLFGGLVVAEAPGDVQLRTPIGFDKEKPHHELRFEAIARDGRSVTPTPIVVDLSNGEFSFETCSPVPWPVDPCYRVPEGDLSVMSFVKTVPGWQDTAPNVFQEALHTALVGDPEVTITGDTTMVLDARGATEVAIDTPAHDATANLGGALALQWYREPADGPGFSQFLLNYPGAQLEERFFLQPMEPVTIGSFAASSRWRLEEPAITMTVPGADDVTLDPQYYRPVWFSDNSWQFPRVDGRQRLPLADAGEAGDGELTAGQLDGTLALVRRSDGVPVAEQSNRAAAAGAELVAIYNDQPGVNAHPGGSGVPLEVPTVRLSHEAGRALLDLLDDGPVTVTAEGTVASPYLYDLVYLEEGGIPDDLHYTADPNELVAVERDFHSQVTDDMTFSEASWPFQPWDNSSITQVIPLASTPRTRTDYHVSDPAMRWSYGVQTPEPRYNAIFPPPPQTASLNFVSPLVSYEPGERRDQAWFKQPLAPGFDRRQPVTREGDILAIPTAGLVDAELNFTQTFSSLFDNGLDALFRVWHGDEVLAETRFLPSGTILMPNPDEDTYRITYDIENRSLWARLSTRTRSEWTFRSTRTDAREAVPLLTLDYDLEVDLRNRMPAPQDRRGPNVIEIDVGHQPGVAIPVTSLTVAASYDDGETWRDRPVRRIGPGRYAINLDSRSPRHTSGFLSLRATARDADGNRIDQEVIRAAALPRPPGGATGP